MTDILQAALKPAHAVGDKVLFGTNPVPGKVIRVIPVVSYKYVVEWEDNDPTAIYEEQFLSKISSGYYELLGEPGYTTCW